MTDGAADRSTPNVTRRRIIAGGLMAAGATAGLTHLWLGSNSDAPVALRETGGFKAVYVIARDDQTNVDAALFYPYGERHNPMAEGLAHYLEHLVWNNVRTAGSDGGRHSNALTSPNATGYMLSRARDDLPQTLRRLIASASPLQSSPDYARQERDIVRHEYDYRALEKPMWSVWEDTDQAIFGDSAYARRTLGTPATITTFDLAQAQALHDQTHQLAQATLIIKGPVTPADVTRAIDAIDDWPIPRAAPLPVSVPQWAERTELNLARSTVDGISTPQLILRQTHLGVPNLTWPQMISARDILLGMMFSTQAGSLVRPLRYDAFTARTIDAGLHTLSRNGLAFWLTATPDQGITLDTLYAETSQHLTTLLTAPGARLFDEIKDRLLARYDSDLNPADTNAHALFDAYVQNAHFATSAELRAATHALSYAEFNTFTRHLTAPRSAAVRLISPTKL
ncbi:MAG: insulinase family protein [Pseudoruegeria sp.]